MDYIQNYTYITSIGNSAFNNCSNLIGTYYNKLNTLGGVCTVGAGIFSNTGVIFTIDLADGLVSIGNGKYDIKDNAYNGATSLIGTIDLTKININGNIAVINKIGKNAFYGCTGITEVILPNTISSIESYAFSNCSNLRKVNLEDTSIPIVQEGCFTNCVSLEEFICPNSLTQIGKIAFNNCSGLNSVTINENLQKLYSQAFYACRNLKTITGLENSQVYYIHDRTFSYSKITKLTLPDTCIDVLGAFADMPYLEEVRFLGDITKIDSNAFSSCSLLKSIIFTDISKITYIGPKAFYGCPLLELDLSGLPSTCSIGADAFTGSPNIIRP